MNNKYPILIVEDCLVEQRFLKKKLSDNGYEVVVASNGKDALKILKKNFFPIIITDWMMPEMDGLELCSMIRKKNFRSYIFIILLTSKTQQNDIITGLEAGADDYLTKPVNLPELTARLRAGERVLELEKNLSNALEKIKIMAITDELTGCYNRRYLMNHLSREIGRSTRYHHDLSIAMYDIDHFKRVNDTYGHHIGDIALSEIVCNIQSVIRADIDWIARYGGEEFVLVFPETDLKGANKAIERIREKIDAMVIHDAPKDLKLTLSFGIRTFEPLKNKKRTLTSKEFIKKADEYLYKAKEEGRNRAISGPL